MKIIFAFSGPREGDGHVAPLVREKVSEYLCSYYYMRQYNNEQVRILTSTGMPLRKK